MVHVVAGIHYVAAGSTHPIAPYTTWSTAATNILDAVDAAVEPGAVVRVTNGIYATGGRVVGGATNRLATHGFMTVRSVNGPQFTAIPAERGATGRIGFQFVVADLRAALRAGVRNGPNRACLAAGHERPRSVWRPKHCY